MSSYLPALTFSLLVTHSGKPHHDISLPFLNPSITQFFVLSTRKKPHEDHEWSPTILTQDRRKLGALKHGKSPGGAYLSVNTLGTTPDWGLVEMEMSAKLTQGGLSPKFYKKVWGRSPGCLSWDSLYLAANKHLEALKMNSLRGCTRRQRDLSGVVEMFYIFMEMVDTWLYTFINIHQNLLLKLYFS